MNSNKYLWVSLIVVAIIAIGAYFFPKQVAELVGNSGTRFPNGISADTTSPSAGQVRGTTLTATATTTLGSAGTATYYTIGGVDYADVQVAIAATSTYACIIQNPFPSATSTIVSWITDITAGNTGATTYDLSTTSAANGFGSSSPALVFAHAVQSGTTETMSYYPSATTTNVQKIGGPGDGSIFNLMSPGNFLSMRIATGTPSPYTAYQGTCSLTVKKP